MYLIENNGVVSPSPTAKVMVRNERTLQEYIFSIFEGNP
jgi:hypothetical protein